MRVGVGERTVGDYINAFASYFSLARPGLDDTAAIAALTDDLAQREARLFRSEVCGETIRREGRTRRRDSPAQPVYAAMLLHLDRYVLEKPDPQFEAWHRNRSASVLERV